MRRTAFDRPGSTAAKAMVDQSGHEKGTDRFTGDLSEFSEKILVGLSPEESERRWDDPKIFARAVSHFAVVTFKAPDLLEWKVETPGKPLFWESQKVDRNPGQSILWVALPHADVPNELEVAFHPLPDPERTEIQVTVRIGQVPPARDIDSDELEGALTPERIAETLRRFKAEVESWGKEDERPMAATEVWTDWHLTPAGWQKGSALTESSSEVIDRDVPSDRVQTYHYSESAASDYAPAKETMTLVWESDDKEAVRSLREKYGDPETGV